MLSEQSKGIHKFIFERICQIQDEIIINDPEYIELGKLPSELFHRLLKKLPPEDRDTLDQYSSEYCQQLNRQDEILYSRGLFDGIYLCKWIERVGRGEKKRFEVYWTLCPCTSYRVVCEQADSWITTILRSKN